MNINDIIKETIESFEHRSNELKKRIDAHEKECKEILKQIAQESEKSHHPEKSPWNLDVDLSLSVNAYKNWYPFGDPEGWIIGNARSNFSFTHKKFTTKADAEHCIKAHQMQYRLAIIEEAARDQWGFGKDFDLVRLINHRPIDYAQHIEEVERLMEGRENLELALKGPWRV